MKNPKELRKKLRHNQSDPERILWENLRNRKVLGLKFRRQVTILNYTVDFFCHESNLIIEVDGSHHFTNKSVLKDKERDRRLTLEGYTVLRFSSVEIFQYLYYVIKFIEHWHFQNKKVSKPGEYEDFYENRKTRVSKNSNSWRGSLW